MACTHPAPDFESELIATEKAFCKAAYEEGIGTAFLKFANDEAVILRNRALPIVGRDSLSKHFGGAGKDQVELWWKPTKAQASKEGDLGYTYGEYKVITKDSARTVINSGNYFTIWERNEAGEWKWVLDGGTENQ